MKERLEFLLLLSITLSGLWCQTSTSLSVTEGQRAALSCLLLPDNSTGVVSWYRQSPGEGPHLVLTYHLNNTSKVLYGHGFNSSRFTVFTKENETFQHQLLIRTTTDDTAVYYCGMSTLQLGRK
ncbi:hypothetical protein MATL_G00028040 [Megalops atlanticus]|uniref:Ig-like domain-containing protein n=1 Tax=Megalops atlanticus TaxID=7932 RepID=A0A9D3QDL5_MEGAT|nr:hypothetical protein MATL_G00028040 [Megalops atlanticus]